MHGFRFVAIPGALARCLPCVLLSILATAGAGGATLAPGSRLAGSGVMGVSLFAAGIVLLAFHLARRRSCEVAR
jgi:hypothetical protein